MSAPSTAPSCTAGASTVGEVVGILPQGSPPDHLPVDASRTAWLAQRKLGLGGSDIAAVLGMSPWTSPFALWAEKVGLLPDLDDPTEAMEFGSRAEDMLGRWFADRTGMSVAGEQTSVIGAEPWMRCTVDGFVFDTPARDDMDESSIRFGEGGAFSINDAIAVAEWKTTSDRAEAWATQVPDHYATQATWTSIVTGIPVVWFGVLHIAFGRPQFRTYQFVPDAADKQLVLDAARAFWFDHCVTGVPPVVDGSDSTRDALAAIYPEHVEGEVVELDDETIVLLEQRAECKSLEKITKATVQEIDNVVAAVLGSAEVALIDGLPAYTYRSQRRTTTCEACSHAKTSEPFRVLRAAPKPRKKAV